MKKIFLTLLAASFVLSADAGQSKLETDAKMVADNIADMVAMYDGNSHGDYAIQGLKNNAIQLGYTNPDDVVQFIKIGQAELDVKLPIYKAINKAVKENFQPK